MQSLKFSPGKWDLDDVLAAGSGDEVDRRLAALKSRAEKFEKLREGLDSFRKEDVHSALSSYEKMTDEVSRLIARSYMEFSTDTGDQGAKSFLDRAEEMKADIDNRVLFFRLWWTGLDERRADSLLPDDPDLRYFLGLWRKLKPYTLEEKVEQALNLKNLTGFSAWTHHYDKVVSGFTFRIEVGGKVMRDHAGKPRAFVVDEVTRMFTSPDPATREAAYRALLTKYAESGEVLGEVYRTIARDWKNENVKLRGYASAIEPRNVENDVSDRAVETLLKVCREEAGVFQDFFRAKASLLGMKKMSRYHIYAPLSRKERRVQYGEAISMVLQAYEEFDHRVARLARKVFESNHVDSLPRKGKTNGAYCYSITPEVVPYIFLNYSGSNRDVYTVAHESGHAVHSQLASGHSVLTFQPPLVLAETASVFGEMILFDKYMREEKDDEVRKGVLLDKISSMYGTIARQAYFVVFENRAHPAINEGATVSELCREYYTLLGEQFGQAVSIPDEFRWEWTYIPHIYHTPFYCYAYAFGNLLSLALYDMYVSEGKGFVPKYLKLLSSGGSRNPGEVLEDLGVDVASAKFWKGGFGVVRRMVDELQKL